MKLLAARGFPAHSYQQARAPPGAALRRQAGNKEEFSSSRAETDLGLLEMTDQCWGQSEKFLPIDCRQI